MFFLISAPGRIFCFSNLIIRGCLFTSFCNVFAVFHVVVYCSINVAFPSSPLLLPCFSGVSPASPLRLLCFSLLLLCFSCVSLVSPLLLLCVFSASPMLLLCLVWFSSSASPVLLLCLFCFRSVSLVSLLRRGKLRRRRIDTRQTQQDRHEIN